jgi:PPOX class probable F420-dependent enzyme
MATIPNSHRDLLEGPVYAIFTTIAPDGMPENSVVWCSMEGNYVLVNTAEGRRKDRNIRSNPRVALTAMDPENPYRWIDVRGTVEEIVDDPDARNISAHAKIYAGVDEYYGGVAPAELRGKEKRIIYKIKPERVVAFPSS